MKAARALRVTAFLLLAMQAVLRLLIVIAPDPFFAIDPRVLAIPLEGLGPAGSVVLDAMALLGCTAALLAELAAQRAVDVKLVALMLLPVPILAWHGWGDADQLRAGSQWIAAIATAVGAAHLAREPRWRILLLGAAVAVTIPLAIKGLYQVTIEHADTLRAFEQHRQALLESKGWEAGSSSAEIYFRRLTQREATGWLSLSNVYGSIMAMLATFWVGAALAVGRSKLQSGWLGMVIIVAAAALTGLTTSFSKGAVAAAVVGLVLAAFCLMPRRWKQHLRPQTARLTFMLIAAALIVTALRGILFPDSLHGADGYSLLFRWHYWLGAGRMLAHHPFTGVGPAGFQNAYLLYRPTLSPEEVASAHSVFIDWLAGAGAAALAWVALTLLLLRRAAPRAGGAAPEVSPIDADAAAPRPGWAQRWLMALVLTLLAGGGAWILNRRVLLIDYHLLLMPLSLAAMCLTVALVEFLVRHVSLGLLRWGVWAALTVVLLHSQIEMTMTQPGSTAIVMLLLGSASARAMRDDGARRSLVSIAVAAVVAVLAIAQIALVVAPIARIQSRFTQAHSALQSVGVVRASLEQAAATRGFDDRVRQLQSSERELRRAGESIDLQGAWRELGSAASLRDAARVNRLLATATGALHEALDRLEVQKIAAALSEFEQARHLAPLDATAWRESSRLWMRLAQLHDVQGDAAARDEAADLACGLAEELAQRRADIANDAASAARRWYERHALDAQPDWLDNAINWQKRVAALDPNGLEAHQTLARLLDEAGREDEALAAYARTLEINANMRLDPLKQLSPSRLEQVQQRVDDLSGG